MPNGDLDLETGDPARSGAAEERRRRRRERSSSKDKTTEAATGPTEGEVRHQLARAFDGLVRNREARGDDELAEVLRDDADAMSEGFITLTKGLAPLRYPLVIVLNMVITLLAFGRVGGIIVNRIAERRAARQAERQAAEQGIPPEYGPDAEVVQ